MTDNALITWSVLLPVKVLARAKSRLAELAGPHRAELALALACDTVAAVRACEAAARVIVITDDQVAAAALRELGAVIVPDEPRDGLNAALRHGARYAAARWPGPGPGPRAGPGPGPGPGPGAGTAALSADLPALRPAELARALSAAAAWPNSFVADAAGDGTTMYAATPGAAFRPAFGPASRARHAAAGAAELSLAGVPGLRRDVDTPGDLRDAAGLGLGPRSAPLAAELLRCAPRGR